MKKHLLIALSVGVVVPALAQQQQVNRDQARIPAHLWQQSGIKPNFRQGGIDPLSQLVQDPNPTVTAGTAKAGEVVIGNTTYDLQTNASVQNRIYVFSDGSISAVWTTSNSGDLNAADRGTGYNHKPSTGNWLYPGSSNSSRIENTTRTGWPSLFEISSNGEASLSHTGTNTLSLIKSAPKGGNWGTETILGGNVDSLLWPRAKSSMTGDTIHLFALTIPVANQGAVYAGLDGAITYSRSTDGGTTWGIQKMILQGTAASDGYFGFSGDGYAMDVKGDNVVMLIGDQWYDTFIMKSTDGGDTWTKTMVWQNPMQNYDYISDNAISDYNNDGIADTVLANDGSNYVVLDNNGVAHCFFGQMRGLNDATGDGNSSYFPFTDGLLYWNENMPANQPDTIGYVLDLDNNGTFDVSDIGTYFLSLASMPSATVDANGDLYVTYSAPVEYTDAALGQAFRNVYAVKSTDGGANWSTPVNITPSDFDEAVFASLSNRSPGTLHMVYQKDQLPGLAVRGDQHAFVTNEIIYADVPKTLSVSPGFSENSSASAFSVFPNPADQTARVTFETATEGMTTVTITSLTGSRVAEFSNQSAAGYNMIDLDVSDLSAGVYVVSVRNGSSVSTSKLVVK